MSEKNKGLNDHLAHKKRIQRMKTGVVWFVFTWMMALTLISVTLIAKIHSFQEQLDIITENTIRSQQVEQQQHQSANTGDMRAYGQSLLKAGGEQQGSSGLKAGLDGSGSDEGASQEGTEDESSKDSSRPDSYKDKKEVRKVYLTFDDGPSKNTDEILDILDKYKVKATFFVTGREDKDSLKRYQEIVSRGHTIGMHSYSHKYDTIYKSRKAFKKDLRKIQKCIQEATGQKCMFYRFPGGSSNQVSKLNMGEFIRILNEEGITYFDWNAECGDASAYDYTSQEMVDNVMRDVVKYHTSVVLLHDAENKLATVEALSGIIEQIQAMDAQILPIDKDTRVVQHVSAESVED